MSTVTTLGLKLAFEQLGLWPTAEPHIKPYVMANFALTLDRATVDAMPIGITPIELDNAFALANQLVPMPVADPPPHAHLWIGMFPPGGIRPV